ncbi:hypothetical protein BDQ17DRAFT_1436778 [Cyathus striatus]|nr:hypothetical protein BDQ17DRAFT_1436778 [Cyathus striatus]
MAGLAFPCRSIARCPYETDDPNWTTNSANSRCSLVMRRSVTGGARVQEGGREGEMEKRVAGMNTGNNLHVSELTYKADTHELEATFAKIGRVSVHFLAFHAFVYAGYNVLLPASLMYFSSFAFSPFSLASLLSYPLLLPSYLFSLSLLPLLFPTFSPSSFAAPFLLPLSPSHFSHSSHTSPLPYPYSLRFCPPFRPPPSPLIPPHPFLASSEASVVYDLHTRVSRSFGFVTMGTSEEADAAITALNTTEIWERSLVTVEKVILFLPRLR